MSEASDRFSGSDVYGAIGLDSCGLNRPCEMPYGIYRVP